MISTFLPKLLWSTAPCLYVLKCQSVICSAAILGFTKPPTIPLHPLILTTIGVPHYNRENSTTWCVREAWGRVCMCEQDIHVLLQPNPTTNVLNMQLGPRHPFPTPAASLYVFAPQQIVDCFPTCATPRHSPPVSIVKPQNVLIESTCYAVCAWLIMPHT